MAKKNRAGARFFRQSKSAELPGKYPASRADGAGRAILSCAPWPHGYKFESSTDRCVQATFAQLEDRRRYSANGLRKRGAMYAVTTYLLFQLFWRSV